MSAYPVTYECDYVEKRSRLTTFFRLILVIPLAIFGFFYGLAALFASIGAWFAVVFTGKYPPGLYEFLAGWVRWQAQFNGYCYLLTDTYAPFSGTVEDYPVRVSFDGPLAEYSRVKALFRIILAIPLLVIFWVLSILLELGAIASWFVIVFTGKEPKGLQDLLVMGFAYLTRGYGYIHLLTETYPPFEDEAASEGGAAAIPPAAEAGVPPAAPDTPPIAPSPEAPPAAPDTPPIAPSPEAPPAAPDTPPRDPDAPSA